MNSMKKRKVMISRTTARSDAGPMARASGTMGSNSASRNIPPSQAAGASETIPPAAIPAVASITITEVEPRLLKYSASAHTTPHAAADITVPNANRRRQRRGPAAYNSSKRSAR